MKSLLFVAASALAFAAGGCTAAQKPVARAALDCPETEGELTRTAVAPDHRSCTYRNRGGSEITLRLVNTDGDPRAALKAIETDLIDTPAPGMPAATAASTASEAAATAAAARDAARAADEARKDADASVVVDIDIDGKKVAAKIPEDAETTRVDLPGIHIVAGDEKADIRVGGITVNARDDEATIRIFTDQRLKGEAFSREKRGLKATFIYTGDNLANGYRFVGYEAAGPKAGPLTVAVVRSRESEGDDHDLDGDVKRLVSRNSGV